MVFAKQKWFLSVWKILDGSMSQWYRSSSQQKNTKFEKYKYLKSFPISGYKLVRTAISWKELCFWNTERKLMCFQVSSKQAWNSSIWLLKNLHYDHSYAFAPNPNINIIIKHILRNFKSLIREIFYYVKCINYITMTQVYYGNVSSNLRSSKKQISKLQCHWQMYHRFSFP